MKKITSFTLLYFFVSCANVSSIPRKVTRDVSSSCDQEYASSERKHLVTAARIKSSTLVNCFKNYLRFEQNKKQKISVCNQLSIQKNGRVSYVQVTNSNKKNLPKDFQMCIEQEYWSMNFKGLQLEESHLIRFQLNFSSI